MSERMTGISAPGISGIAESGRKTRAEMIPLFRTYYEQQRVEAEKALALSDEDLVVETYLGPWAMKNREVVS